VALADFLFLLAIAGVCGVLGQLVAGYSHGGCLVAVVVGFIGAYLGSWLSDKVGLPEMLRVEVGGATFPLLWSVIGSAFLVALISLVSGRRW